MHGVTEEKWNAATNIKEISNSSNTIFPAIEWIMSCHWEWFIEGHTWLSTEDVTTWLHANIIDKRFQWSARFTHLQTCQSFIYRRCPTMTLTTCRTVLEPSPDGTSITICCSTQQKLRLWSQAHGNKSRSLKIRPRRFTVVPCSNSVRILGVAIDSQLTFDKQVTNVVQSCNYHIRSLRHIYSLTDKDTATILACSIVSSRLDYCNATALQ